MDNLTIITGGGTGIGRAIATYMADNNQKILIVGRREEPLQKTAQHNPELISYVSADVGNADGRRKISAAAGDETVKYLVHNAAILGDVKPLMDYSEEEWETIVRINLTAPLFLSRELLPKMDHSRILHISSGAAHHAIKSWAGYCVTKAGLHMLYRLFNEEVDPAKAICGSLRPGIVDTPMQGEIRSADLKQHPHLQKFHDLYKADDLVDPVEVAQFVLWALTEADVKTFTEKELDIRD